MADIKIKISIKDKDGNLDKFTEAINGLYLNWEKENPEMDLSTFMEELIMKEYLIPLVNKYEKTQINLTARKAMSDLTHLRVEHGE